MIRLARVKVTLKLLAPVLFLIGCDSFDDDAGSFSELQLQREAITKTWNTDQVIFDNIDATDQENFREFTITFNDNGTWDAQNGEPIFLSNGNWAFQDNNINVINMDGNTVLIGFSIDKAQSRVLTLTFSAQGNAIGSRSKSLNGQYIFRLSTLE